MIANRQKRAYYEITNLKSNMKKHTISDKGFHAIGVIMVLCVVGVIGLAGLRIFNLRNNSLASGQPNASTAPVPLSQQVPAGSGLFADSQVGVQFIYPEVFGAFTDESRILDTFPNYESMRVSKVLQDSGILGVSGGFMLITYKEDRMEVDSRKYGPRVRLTDNGWVVTKPATPNPENYKEGDAYGEMIRSNKRGLVVYSSASHDAGTVSYSLFFVAKGRLHELKLPFFDSGSYTSNSIKDQGPYDTMFQQVRDSIGLYQ